MATEEDTLLNNKLGRLPKKDSYNRAGFNFPYLLNGKIGGIVRKRSFHGSASSTSHFYCLKTLEQVYRYNVEKSFVVVKNYMNSETSKYRLTRFDVLPYIWHFALDHNNNVYLFIKNHGAGIYYTGLFQETVNIFVSIHEDIFFSGISRISNKFVSERLVL